MAEKDLNEDENDILHAHDLYFRKILSNKEVASEFFELNLPAEVKKLVKLETLKLCPETFIDRKLRRVQTDILYAFDMNDPEIPHKDNSSATQQKPNTAYFYCLTEQQTEAEPLMAWRLHQYVVKIIDHHLAITKSKTLPLVFTTVFYSGSRSPYPYSTSFYDLFGVHKQLAKHYLSDFHLVDLTQLPDSKISSHQRLGLLEITMKYIRSKDLLNRLETQVENLQGSRIKNVVKLYIVKVS